MNSKALTSLAYAIRPRVVARYFGQLCLTLSGLAGVPMAVALGTGEWDFAFRCLHVLLLVGAAGLLLSRLPAPRDIQINEALAVTALIFVAASLVMTWPLMLIGRPFVDILFESVSGITTTGLSTLPSVESLSPAILFTRAWLQWYGGLAIVVLALALLLEPGIVARRLTEAGGVEEDLVGSTRVRARRALAVYGLLTMAAIGALLLAGTPFGDAVTHGLAAVSTGGFSSRDASIAGLGGAAASIATAFSFLGAISIAVYYRTWRSGWRRIAGDPEVRALAALMVASAAAIMLIERATASGAGETLWDVAMTAVSAQTTTGFAPLAIHDLSPGSRLVLVFSMFVGGDTGSTAGGFKIVRLLMLIALVGLTLRRTALTPHAVADIEIGGYRPAIGELQGLLTLLGLYAAVNALSWMAFVDAGHDPLNSLFDVVSATATVGLSTGVTGPELATSLKLLLCGNMLMGRLEIVAILVLFYPPTWLGRRARVS